MAETGTYVPIYAVAPWHRKMLKAGRDAFVLWVVALCYCKLQLSDGFIDTDALRVLPLVDPQQVDALAAKLVEVGLWEVRPDGYQFHDYLNYNLSRDDVSELLEMRRAAGSMGGQETAARRRALVAASAAAGASSGAQGAAAPKRREEKVREDKTREGTTEIAPRSASAEPPLLIFPTVGPKGTEWAFTEAYRVELATAYPNLDILAEARHALQWAKANPTKRKTIGGMEAFLVNWMNRASNGSGMSRTPMVGSLKTAGNEAALKEMLRRRGHAVD